MGRYARHRLLHSQREKSVICRVVRGLLEFLKLVARGLSFQGVTPLVRFPLFILKMNYQFEADRRLSQIRAIELAPRKTTAFGK